MHLDTLAAFCEVYERQSFTTAARALGLDASVVSRRVKALEDELDVALFTRSTRAVTNTAAGDALYERVAPAVRVIEEARLAVRLERDQLKGGVRVSAPSSLGRLRIAPVIHRYCAAHPQVEVELLLTDRRIDLFAEGVDLAIRPVHPGPESVLVRRLGGSEQWLVASSAYLAAHPAPALRPGGLAGHRLVLRTDAGARQDFRQRLPPEVREGLGVSFVTDDMGAVADAVRAGLGLGLVPRWLVQADVDAGAMVHLQLGTPHIEVPVFAVLPAGRRTTARTRALLDALVADWADAAATPDPPP